MIIHTYDKDGNHNNVVWKNVKNVHLMFIPGTLSHGGLLDLRMTFKNGEETSMYLSHDERFAIIKEEEK